MIQANPSTHTTAIMNHYPQDRLGFYDQIPEELQQHEIDLLQYPLLEDEPKHLQHWVQQHEMAYLNENFTPRFYTNMLLPTASLPGAAAKSQQRLTSPPLSQDMSSSSSMSSPPAEAEYYQEQHIDFEHAHHHYAQPVYASYDAAYAPQSSYSQQCIAMNQIQDFPDTDIVNTSHDAMAGEIPYLSSRHFRTEELTKDTFLFNQTRQQQQQLASPPASGADQDDRDADGETEEEDEEADVVSIQEYPDPEDTDYKPNRGSTRPRRRVAAARASHNHLKQNVTSGRVTKGTSPKNKLACRFCASLHAFPTATALAEHMSNAHTRNYTCVFAFAGCASTFASKNEWKRHTSSQHLNLAEWICAEGSCGKSTFRSHISPDIEEYGSLYNRKDLFTSHLRRMHAPVAVKDGCTDNAWNAKVAQLHCSAKRTCRKPPSKLICTVGECGAVFTGKAAWEDRMEHVGKHLEKGNLADQEDPYLMQWAAQEGIIVKSAGGKWALAPA